MKGVILCGGLGSRLYPLTKVTNKHLLPVYNKPMVYYPILTLIEGGITDILVVTGGNKAGHFLELLGNGSEFGLKHLNYTYQQGEGGIADALGLAEHFVADDKVVVVLGDNIIEGSIKHAVDRFREQPSGARVLLKEVPDPQRFGVPEIKDGKIISIVEKPKEPKSNYAVTGIYFYDSFVWEVIKSLTPSERGELEITDVNNAYINKRELSFEILEGWWTDAGTFDSLLLANRLMAQREGKSPEQQISDREPRKP